MVMVNFLFKSDKLRMVNSENMFKLLLALYSLHLLFCTIDGVKYNLTLIDFVEISPERYPCKLLAFYSPNNPDHPKMDYFLFPLDNAMVSCDDYCKSDCKNFSFDCFMNNDYCIYMPSGTLCNDDSCALEYPFQLNTLEDIGEVLY